MITKYSNKKAFTLVEIIIVLVIIMIGVAIFAPRITTGIDSVKFRDSITGVVTFLRKAHLNAMVERKDIDVNIDFEGNMLLIDDESFPLPPNITLELADSSNNNEEPKYTFFYNGRGTGPEIHIIGSNEREATVYVDSLSGLARSDFE